MFAAHISRFIQPAKHLVQKKQPGFVNYSTLNTFASWMIL